MSDTVISSAFDSFETLCVTTNCWRRRESTDQSLSSISREQTVNFMTAARRPRAR